MRPSMYVALAALAWAPPARGDGALGENTTIYDDIGNAITIGELLIPDVRREVPFGDDDPRWVLSWPIVPVSIALYEYGETGPSGIKERHGIRLAPFGEPQYRSGGESPALRFAGGARTTWFREGASPCLELGGVVGVDGNGGFVGLGFGFGSFEEGMSLSLVSRFVTTTEEQSVDFALDVQLPFGH